MNDRMELYVGLAILVSVGLAIGMGSGKSLMVSTHTVTTAMKEAPVESATAKVEAKKRSPLDELRAARKAAKETALQAGVGIPMPSVSK